MKTKSIFQIYLFFLLLTNMAKAEEFDVQMNPSLYAGGYNISCHGSNTGSINLFISGGRAPYTFVWNDGNTNRNRTNLVAGYYQVTVTGSDGSSVVRELTLTEPELFQAILHPSELEGGNNISENGGSDGYIESQIQGGVPPYTYLWSNGSTDVKAQDLTAGTYSLTVHDATNCTATASITLVEPTVLHIISITSPVIGNSIYNTSCGLENGTINLNVAGGTPPYEFNWSNGAFTQNIGNLRSGDYFVRVIDQNGVGVEANITLTSSPVVEANLVAFTYGNGKNTSCYSCNNGSISISNLVGVAPFTFAWNSGQTTQNITNVAAGNYYVTVTDALGCATESGITLVAADREVWTMNGNSGTNPATQYIGTTDNTDLLIKTNGIERFKLLGNGDLKLSMPGITSNGGGPLYIDANGILRSNSQSDPGTTPPNCASNITQWEALSNSKILWTCPNIRVGIGTYTFGANNPRFKVSGNSHFDGNVGIGTDYFTKKLVVKGDVQFLDDQSNSNSFEINGNDYTPNHRGISIDDLNSGKMKFYLDSYVNPNSAFEFKDVNNPTATPLMTVSATGTVAINYDLSVPYSTAGNHYSLVVGGTLGANEIWVTGSAPWPDYVFDQSYKLTPICDLEHYLKSNNHLPGFPSAKQIDNEKKYNVSEVTIQLTQKLEEAYLYIIEASKRLEKLEAKNAELEVLMKNSFKK